MYYEISLKYRPQNSDPYHFFTTEKIPNSKKCEEVYNRLLKSFPESGYEISIRRIEEVCYMIDPSDIHGRGESTQ